MRHACWRAKQRDLYHELIHADMRDWMQGRHAEADLILAADMLIYCDTLETVFERVATMLRPGGIFAATAEKPDGAEECVLRKSRRYAHSENYIRKMAAAASLDVAVMEQVGLLRREGKQEIPGLTPKSIIGASTFGTFLAEMLGGINSGYWRVATKSLNTDWTEAVDWLLKITLPRTFGHKATLGTTRHPRQVETEIRLSLQSVTSVQKYSGRSLQVLSPFLDQKIFQGEKENGINLLYFELENTQP